MIYFIWMWIGVKLLKWPCISVYSPDKENVVAVTFSDSEEFINEVHKID